MLININEALFHASDSVENSAIQKSKVKSQTLFRNTWCCLHSLQVGSQAFQESNVWIYVEKNPVNLSKNYAMFH